jgi:hypothetical protein
LALDCRAAAAFRTCATSTRACCECLVTPEFVFQVFVFQLHLRLSPATAIVGTTSTLHLLFAFTSARFAVCSAFAVHCCCTSSATVQAHITPQCSRLQSHTTQHPKWNANENNVHKVPIPKQFQRPRRSKPALPFRLGLAGTFGQAAGRAVPARRAPRALARRAGQEEAVAYCNVNYYRRLLLLRTAAAAVLQANLQ